MTKEEKLKYRTQCAKNAIKEYRYRQALSQEQKYCDRNICLRNEYNNIGCDECEVQEPTDENLHREREQAYMLGYEDASKRFRQEPSEDAISRQAIQTELKNCKVVDMYDENDDLVGYYNAGTVDSIVRNLPSVNPQPICEEREKGECPWYAG